VIVCETDVLLSFITGLYCTVPKSIVYSKLMT